jgi:hypothetical protein
MAVRTYAKQGQTPILKIPLTRNHRKVIGALMPLVVKFGLYIISYEIKV